MPNRILREGINRSRTVSKLSEEAELFYRRLMSVVDDYGRCENDPEVLLLSCFPFRLATWNADRVRKCIADVTQMPYTWVADDKQVHGTLVTAYEVAGRSYLQINNFRQPTRSKPRHPDPPLRSNCVADASQRPLSPNTNTNTHSNTNSKTHSNSEPDSGLPDDAFEQILAAYPRKHASARAEFRNLISSTPPENALKVFNGILSAAKTCAKFPAHKRGFLPGLGVFIEKRWQDDWESELRLAESDRAPSSGTAPARPDPDEELRRAARLRRRADKTL